MARSESERIRASVSDTKSARVEQIEVFPEIESTNSYLMEQPPPLPGNWRVALADRQTAGRGRMDNEWQSPPMSGLYLSASITFARMPQHFSCLTLAIGVGVVEALKSLGVGHVRLKWPNDLVLNNGKLGGILTELQPSSGEAVTVVIGVGINVRSRGKLDYVTSAIGRIAELSEVLDEMPERCELAATVVEAMIDTADRFDADGFSEFHERWTRHDWLLGKEVCADSPTGRVCGTVMGIDNDGALLINDGSGLKRILSGSVAMMEKEPARNV